MKLAACVSAQHGSCVGVSEVFNKHGLAGSLYG